MGPIEWFFGYYSAHPRKGRVVLSQLPLVLWAPGCWHYERTLYSRRPLEKGPEFLSIYLFSVTYTICEGPKLDHWVSESVTPANCQYDFIHQHKQFLFKVTKHLHYDI